MKEIRGIFSFKMAGRKQLHSIDSQILSRIRSRGGGWVFTPADFHDLGSRTAIDLALLRHKRTGTIRQLARGIYDLPSRHPRLGLLSPSVDAIARAVAGREASRLEPSGAYAANLLGLSDQVPMKVVFLTDGPSRKVQIGKQEIILKRTTPRNMAASARTSGLVIQALRHLGRRHVDDSVVHALQRRLTDDEKKQLLSDLPYAPGWVAGIMRQIAEPRQV
jgi:Family of unknown function (DUF6088)